MEFVVYSCEGVVDFYPQFHVDISLLYSVSVSVDLCIVMLYKLHFLHEVLCAFESEDF